MKRTVITGADGFVGSATVERFLAAGWQVLALDLAETPRRLKPHDRLVYRRCDAGDPQALREALADGPYDTFIHFAWAGSAGPERTDAHLQTTNALTAVACLEAAVAAGCRRFLGAGSIMEYEVEAAVHAQGSRPGMAYVYGMGKQLAHGLCKTAAARLGVDLLWPMITNAYGVGEYSPRFVNTTLRKMIAGEPLQFTAATQNYDFVYVTDVAEAFYRIAVCGRPFREYMIGSGHARPLREFICEMQQACAPDSVLQFGDIPFTGTNLPLSVFDISALREDCGFVPGISFAEGTRHTMEWLKTL